MIRTTYTKCGVIVSEDHERDQLPKGLIIDGTIGRRSTSIDDIMEKPKPGLFTRLYNAYIKFIKSIP